MSELPSAASKAEIRTVLRQIYNEAGAPNVNQAWNVLKLQMPDASRSRVREVLREPEFVRLRRQPGKRRVVSAAEIGAVEHSIAE